jgi:hypothetical protein
MSSQRGAWLCDEATRAALARPAQRVLLIGSYGGYSNFGDILQLKGAIRWHREHSRLEPVVVADPDALPDGEFGGLMRRWLGVQEIVFWSPRPLDARAAGLDWIVEPPAIAHLHVYGGGFLNRRWGHCVVQAIEDAHRFWGVGHYVLTGQQVDPVFATELREHFARFRPDLFGGRDALSVELVEPFGIPTGYSFDDAMVALDSTADLLRPRGVDESATLLLHMNLSHYALGEADARRRLAEHLHAVAGRVQALAPGGSVRLVLLHAYSDRRSQEIVDSLGAVQQLEHAFGFMHYEVLDLAQMALRLWTDDPPPAVPLHGRLALASSYHVTLLCSLLGVPCYLMTENEYYQQKRAGLAQTADFASFIAAPAPICLDAQRAARGDWLTRLAECYQAAPRPAAPVTYAPPAEQTPWSPKAGLAGQPDRLWAEVQRLTANWETQRAFIQELEAQRDKIWAEAQRLADSWERQNRYIQDQTRYIAELEAQLGKGR